MENDETALICLKHDIHVSFLSYVLADSEAFSCRGDITPQKKQRRLYQEDQGKQTKYRAEVDSCRSSTRATHHKSHVGGE